VSPVAQIDGPLGLEGIHIWNAAITLNSLESFPRYKLTGITGLFDLPDAESNAFIPVAKPFEMPTPSMVRGKTIVYEGVMEASNQQSLAQMRTNLRAAFQNRTVEQQMIISPHADYGAISWAYRARVLACSVEETLDDRSLTETRNPYKRNFTVTVRMMSDARYYRVGATQSISGDSGETVTFTNSGNAPVDPVFVIDGSIDGDLVIERTGNPDARRLELNDLSIGSGNELVINFATRRIYRTSDGIDRDGKLNFADSNWWDEDIWGLMPGNTSVKVTGGAGWTCSSGVASW